MARRATAQRSEALAPPLFIDDRALPSVRLHQRVGFNYTTPSSQPPRSAADRRRYGCEEISWTDSKGKKKKKFTGRLEDGRPDTFCKPTSKPCGERASCPVQLVWVKGQANLRFCVEPGKPGFLVPVASSREAQKLAKKACANWPHKPTTKVQWPKDFFSKNAPEVVEAARRARPDSPWGGPGLGELGGRPKEVPWILQGERGAWVTLMLPVAGLVAVLAFGGKKG